jgi:hypothetical protein
MLTNNQLQEMEKIHTKYAQELTIAGGFSAGEYFAMRSYAIDVPKLLAELKLYKKALELSCTEIPEAIYPSLFPTPSGKPIDPPDISPGVWLEQAKGALNANRK